MKNDKNRDFSILENKPNSFELSNVKSRNKKKYVNYEKNKPQITHVNILDQLRDSLN